MNRIKASLIALSLITVFAVTGCTSNNEAADNAMKDRQDKASAVVLCGEKGDSLECKNQEKRKQRMSDPNGIGYVYEISFDGHTTGYYVIKGKVSSTQSQMGPMDIIADACPTQDYCPQVMEAAGDDGSFGPNEEGIFFFTAVGDVMVTYNGIYRYSDKPLPLLSTTKLG